MNGQFSIGELTPAKYFFGLSAILGVLFALINESDKGLAGNLIQWQLQTILPVSIILSAHFLLCKSRHFNSWNTWLKLFFSGATGAIIFSPVALFIDQSFQTDLLLDGFFSSWVEELLAVLPTVTLAWLAMNAPWVLGYRLRREEEGKNKTETGLSPSTQKTEPEFIALTETQKRGVIIYLKAELHYLSVVTDKGRSLILYSLKDAIEELKSFGLEGIQTHRSYWVASSEIRGFEKRGRQGVIIVSNEEEIPVSRTNMKKFEEKIK